MPIVTLKSFTDAAGSMIKVQYGKSLGMPYIDSWPELYMDPVTAGMVDEYFRIAIVEGKSSVVKYTNFHLRNGFRREERIFTFSIVPVIDDKGKTLGAYERLFEATSEFLQERRSESIRKIEQLTAGEEDPASFFQSLVDAVADNGMPSMPMKPALSPRT